MTIQEAHLLRWAGYYLRLQFGTDSVNAERKYLAEKYFGDLLDALAAGQPAPPLPSAITVLPV